MQSPNPSFFSSHHQTSCCHVGKIAGLELLMLQTWQLWQMAQKKQMGGMVWVRSIFHSNVVVSDVDWHYWPPGDVVCLNNVSNPKQHQLHVPSAASAPISMSASFRTPMIDSIGQLVTILWCWNNDSNPKQYLDAGIAQGPPGQSLSVETDIK